VLAMTATSLPPGPTLFSPPLSPPPPRKVRLPHRVSPCLSLTVSLPHCLPLCVSHCVSHCVLAAPMREITAAAANKENRGPGNAGIGLALLLDAGAGKGVEGDKAWSRTEGGRLESKPSFSEWNQAAVQHEPLSAIKAAGTAVKEAMRDKTSAAAEPCMMPAWGEQVCGRLSSNSLSAPPVRVHAC
jgi:hypothetical protein